MIRIMDNGLQQTSGGLGKEMQRNTTTSDRRDGRAPDQASSCQAEIHGDEGTTLNLQMKTRSYSDNTEVLR